MSEFQDHATGLEETTTPRGPGFRLADLRHRITHSLSRPRDAENNHLTYQHEAATWQDDMPRFSVVRHGYHCASVDQYVSELEQELGELDRELAELRTRWSDPQPAQPEPARPEPESSSEAVAAEIKRVGEQTSAVLIAAHEQAQATVREADAKAERRLTEAQSEATSIIDRANERLHELETEMLSVQRERERLLGEVRSAATALSELVDVSLERFPPPETALESASAAKEPEPVAEEPLIDSSEAPA